VFHHSECKDTPAGEIVGIWEYHVSGKKWRSIGYNFVVEFRDGHCLVQCGREPFMMGSHCRGFNNMVGICLVGNFDLTPPPEAMLDKSARLLKWLMLWTDIEPKKVFDHRDLNDTSCPGKLFHVRTDILPRL